MKRKHLKNLFVVLAIQIAVLLLIWLPKVCQKESDKYADSTVKFYSHSEALQYYEHYLYRLQQSKIDDSESLGKVLNNWRFISDTVYHYLMIDSIFINNVRVSSEYCLIHDRCRNEILKIINTGIWYYSDVINLKLSTSSYAKDKKIHQCAFAAEGFFKSLDEPVLTITKQELLDEYRKFLVQAKHKTYDMNEMLMFIKREDVLFRTFIANLEDMNDDAVVDIAQDTDSVCAKIMLSAKENRMDMREAIVYMSIRAGRRLIQNSFYCLNNIGKTLKDPIRANAYKWMIVQPFISLDQLAMATITSEDLSQLLEIGDELYESHEFAYAYGMELDSLNEVLPREMMKMYILTL